jgi:hypothetical protein
LEDIYRSYREIALTVDPQKRVGAVHEGYIVGGLAGLLLDYLHIDRKNVLMDDAMKTPLDILAEYFDSEVTADDIVLPSEEMIQNYQELIFVSFSPEDLENAAQNMFIILNDMRSQDPVSYELILEEMIKENVNPELMERVLELLESIE